MNAILLCVKMFQNDYGLLICKFGGVNQAGNYTQLGKSTKYIHRARGTYYVCTLVEGIYIDIIY